MADETYASKVFPSLQVRWLYHAAVVRAAGTWRGYVLADDLQESAYECN